MKHHKIAAIVLAAGGSRRMRGSDKLTKIAGDHPLLRRCVLAALASKADEIIVVLGAQSETRLAALEGLPIRTIMNHFWQSGMASSIQQGIESVRNEVDGALIMLGDMPNIDSNILNLLIDAFTPDQGMEIVQPTTETGTCGNPVIFAKRHFSALLELSGDVGAKAIITKNSDYVRNVLVPGTGILTDLDTPEAWQKWKNNQQG